MKGLAFGAASVIQSSGHAIHDTLIGSGDALGTIIDHTGRGIGHLTNGLLSGLSQLLVNISVFVGIGLVIIIIIFVVYHFVIKPRLNRSFNFPDIVGSVSRVFARKSSNTDNPSTDHFSPSLVTEQEQESTICQASIDQSLSHSLSLLNLELQSLKTQLYPFDHSKSTEIVNNTVI